jgi:glutamyl/glutaminyl-tRNA synthetase
MKLFLGSHQLLHMLACLWTKTGQKLSKRNLDIDIASYRDKTGIFPETLTNFVALLGWSHSQKSDIMTLQGLVDNVGGIVLYQLAFALTPSSSA